MMGDTGVSLGYAESGIVVANVRNALGIEQRGEYVGRRMKDYPGSPLANPYYIGIDGARGEVIAKYRAWAATWPEWSRASAELRRLVEIHRERGSLTLLCWCAPKPCHADVIAEMILARCDDGRAERADAARGADVRHWVSPQCTGTACSMCIRAATHKVGEE